MQITIPDEESKIVDLRRHILYHVKVVVADKEWTVSRTMPDIRKLDEQLGKAEFERLPLPREPCIGIRRYVNVGRFNERTRLAAEQYLSHLASQLRSVDQSPALSRFLDYRPAAAETKAASETKAAAETEARQSLSPEARSSLWRATGPRSLRVEIIGATGLRHLNWVGNFPYCECKVNSSAKDDNSETDVHRILNPPTCRTKSMSRTLIPKWEEAFDLDWYDGESLTFSVYNEGLIVSKLDCQVTLPSERFSGGSFEGEIPFDDVPSAKLTVKVTVNRFSAAGTTADISEILKAARLIPPLN